MVIFYVEAIQRASLSRPCGQNQCPRVVHPGCLMNEIFDELTLR